MSANGDHIDRAMWHRYAANNTDRCCVCGKTAQVSISLSATELGRKQGAAIATRKVYLCDEHGQIRYGDALRKLLGTEVIKT